MRSIAPLVLALASAACSRHQTQPGPNVGFAVDAPEVSCRVAGAPAIVASDVYTGDVQVLTRAEGGYDVVVLDDVTPCLRVGIGAHGEKLGTVLGECPAPPTPGRASATNGIETYLVRETVDDSGTYLALGVVTYDWPHAFAGTAREGLRRVVEHRFEVPPGGPGGGAADPALAPFGADHFLLAWTEGDTVRAQPIAGWAEPAGPAITLSPPDLTEIGRPSVAFATPSEGLVAFAASTPTGFHILSVPLVCSR
jgi:hypothetical protein